MTSRRPVAGFARVKEAAKCGLERRMAARAREGGYFTILLAILLSSGFLMAAAATSVDTSRWYDEIARVQKAADAAALAGVPFMPYQFDEATTRAREVAARNGYDYRTPGVTVTVTQGGLASQLKVTITSHIANSFGAVIGSPGITVSRSGTADYKGPAPMGSPCNSFGNEPTAGTGGSSATPSGTVHSSSPFSNCSSSPQFWAVVEGPETGKLQGDRYQTTNCENTANSGVDGCASSSTDAANSEYDDFGYTFIVKVQPQAVGKPIDLQLYDPEFANTEGVSSSTDTALSSTWGDRFCELLPAASSFTTTGNLNPFVTVADAKNRYSSDGSTYTSFCNSDSYPGGGSGNGAGNGKSTANHPMTTSFVLRSQVDSQDPEQAPVQNDISGSPCIKQYGSYATSIYRRSYTYQSNTVRYYQYNAYSADLFNSTKSAYNADLSKVFHNWSSLCTFTPTTAGDYYLQVRTNVSMTGTSLIQSGNSAAAALAGNTTQGEGSNSFAIRARAQSGYENYVAVSGYNHMPIFVNANNTTEFNLIRVLPGAAGQFITFSYYDAGDAEASGYVQVVVPPDATGSITSTKFPNGGCLASGGSAPSTPTAISNCQAKILPNSAYPTSPKPSLNNGRVETISIPIPSDYNCSVTSLGGCWYRVQIQFGSGTVHDVTTWDATITGDPVRLIE